MDAFTFPLDSGPSQPPPATSYSIQPMRFAVGAIATIGGLHTFWQEGQFTKTAALLLAVGAYSLYKSIDYQVIAPAPMQGPSRSTQPLQPDPRQERVAVFQETRDAVKAGHYLYSNADVDIPDTTKGTARLYKKPVKLAPGKARPTEVRVVEGDCVETAVCYQQKGYKTALLNMANASHCGGGVLTGAAAQEEDLCRRSDLYFTLNPGDNPALKAQLQAAFESPTYKIPEFGGIYSETLFFRSPGKQGYSYMKDPARLGVVSSAAYQLTSQKQFGKTQRANTKEKIRGMLRIAHAEGIQAFVLSALGCGAFCNPPDQVAACFKEVLAEDEFSGTFDQICFAIINDHNAPKGGGNVQPFATAFGMEKATPLRDLKL